MDKGNKMITTLIIVGLIIYALSSHYFRWGYDSTDDMVNGKRSNLVLYTDHKTGLQYIRGGLFGGLQPRMTIDGKHMKKEQDEKR